MGGGGGDGGASERAAEDRTRKAEATRGINQLFGIYTPSDVGAPKRETFRTGPLSDTGFPTGPVDEEAYQKALDEFNRKDADFKTGAEANKVARDALYAKEGKATFDLNKNKLDEDRTNADRELKFALARSGLFGGSEDINQHDKEQRAYDKGILQVKNISDQTKSDFTGQDENARLNVINQISQGIDGGTALENARRGLQVSADKAAANATGVTIGNAFDNAGLIYQLQQNNAGIAAARAKYPQLGSYFPSTGSYSGTVNNG